MSSTPGPQRILVRGVNWLGDAVMSTPALQRLRERYPESRIWLLTDQKLADLWHGHRCLDGVHTFARGESPWRIGRRLRSEEFDTALVLPNSTRSALETWAAGIPRRVGYGGRGRSLFLNELVPFEAGHIKMRKRSAREVRTLVSNKAPAAERDALATSSRHHIHQYLHLAAALGASPRPAAPALRLTLSELSAARAKWLAMPDSFLLGLNPSAAYGEAKRWPAENFAAVAREVSAKAPGARWVAIGAREDRECCERMASLAGVPILNLAGTTTLRELMTLLGICRAVVTNDSGPMHLAAALGTPVIALFGSTSPELTGPGLPGASADAVLRSDADCAPCFRRSCPIDFRCMKGISVSQVTTAVLDLLREHTSSPDDGSAAPAPAA